MWNQSCGNYQILLNFPQNFFFLTIGLII
jgi:protein tyrosine phosphatase type IVA